MTLDSFIIYIRIIEILICTSLLIIQTYVLVFLATTFLNEYLFSTYVRIELKIFF